MRLVLTGATGTAGSEVLRQALLNPAVTGVTVISRRPLPPHVDPSPSNPKLKVILHKDFTGVFSSAHFALQPDAYVFLFSAPAYPPELLQQLEGHDACIWALGRTSNGMSEADYSVITYDYALAAAKAFSTLPKSNDKKLVFAYLSGAGTDQREGKAWQMFGRVKGRAEKDLALLPASGYPSLAVYNFRPAGIVPIHPVPEAPALYRSPILLGLIKGLGLLSAKWTVRTDELAKGMIEVCMKGASGEVPGWAGKGKVGNDGVFDNLEIKMLAEGKSRM
ncbi:SPOSA6832_02220, partial [Sporobolomyces salmonicolor]